LATLPLYDLPVRQIAINKIAFINHIFGANTLPDSKFIQESLTILDEKNVRFSSNRFYNEPGRSWHAGVKFQF